MTRRMGCLSLALVAMAIGACAKPKSLVELSANPPDETLGQLYRDAQALESLATTKLAKDFLMATAELPKVETRVAYKMKDRREYYLENQLASLSVAQREALERKEWGPEVLLHWLRFALGVCPPLRDPRTRWVFQFLRQEDSRLRIWRSRPTEVDGSQRRDGRRCRCRSNAAKLVPKS